jgi:hypothetical protein
MRTCACEIYVPISAKGIQKKAEAVLGPENLELGISKNTTSISLPMAHHMEFPLIYHSWSSHRLGSSSKLDCEEYLAAIYLSRPLRIGQETAP